MVTQILSGSWVKKESLEGSQERNSSGSFWLIIYILARYRTVNALCEGRWYFLIDFDQCDGKSLMFLTLWVFEEEWQDY